MNSEFNKYSTYFDNKEISLVNSNPPQYQKAKFYYQWGTCPYAVYPSQVTLTNTYFDPNISYKPNETYFKKK